MPPLTPVSYTHLVDPEAAEIVFQSGIPVVMAGLDVTHKAQIHVEDTERCLLYTSRCV